MTLHWYNLRCSKHQIRQCCFYTSGNNKRITVQITQQNYSFVRVNKFNWILFTAINIPKIDYTSQRLEFVQILHRNKYVQGDIVAHGLTSDWFEGLSTYSTCSMPITLLVKNNEILFTVVTRLYYCNTLLTKIWNYWNVYVRRSLVAHWLASDSRLVQRRDCRHFVRV